MALRTLDALEEQQYRQDAPEPVGLDETAYFLGRLSDEGLERLQSFLDDLTRRAPMGTSVFTAQRTVLESLVSDIGRERIRREQ